jgi:hypothetical protein
VVGFVLAGVYKAGGFYMSTCVCCLCAHSMHILIKFIKLGPVRMGCDPEPGRASGVSGPFFSSVAMQSKSVLAGSGRLSSTSFELL